LFEQQFKSAIHQQINQSTDQFKIFEIKTATPYTQTIGYIF